MSDVAGKTPELAELHKTEMVLDEIRYPGHSGWFITRLRVPGGWIYRWSSGNGRRSWLFRRMVATTTFVPD